MFLCDCFFCLSISILHKPTHTTNRYLHFRYSQQFGIKTYTFTTKDINISKRHINMQSPIPILQCLCDLWGPDAYRFKLERFAHGIVRGSKTPWAYIPFGVSYCMCASQYFAMTESKVVLSLMLFKFCFSLSSSSPAFRLIVVPWTCSHCFEDNLTFFSFKKCKGHLGCTHCPCHYNVAIRELEKRIKRE